jgi:tRNA dimethylallyltransferase
MGGAFFVVGPTAVGKSNIGAEVAGDLGAEVVSADAFQIYQGLDILTGKPDRQTLQRVRHHMFDAIPLSTAMSAVEFGRLARSVLSDIHRRGKMAVVVGGSGLYISALIGHLHDTPPPNPIVREGLSRLSLDQLVSQLGELDAELANRTDLKNRRRVSRALEVTLTRNRDNGRSVRVEASDNPEESSGVLLVRDRDDLYTRINVRVEAMFQQGVEDEVRSLENVGPTAASAIGLREIRRLISGEISHRGCLEKIQQATRRYAKRQLTWFRHQTNFPQLNLTQLSHQEAIRAVTDLARCHFAAA